jgi:hypothetical protein
MIIRRTNMKLPVTAFGRILRAALLASTLAVLAGGSAQAAAPACYTYSGQGYCQYTGKVSQVYVNSSGNIILYFDTAMSASAPGSVGITGVSVYNAGIYNIPDNPDYAKMLYASLLSAQARGATVEVQLWGTYAGYLKLDRIWVNE